MPGLQREFWLDEYATAWVVEAGFAPNFERAWMNNLPPTFFLIARVSVELFGYSEAGLRIPSIAAGVLLVPVLYFLARRMSVSRPLAAIASLFAAIDPSLIEISLEARPYAIVQLVAARQVYAFLEIVDRDAPSGAGRAVPTATFALLTTLCVYLHYLAALILLPEGLYCLYLLATQDRREAMRRIGATLAGLGLVAIVCLPLVGHLRHLIAARADLGSFVGTRPFWYALGRFRILYYLYLPLPVAMLAQFAPRRREKPEPAPCDSSSLFSIFAARPGCYVIFCLLWLFSPNLFVMASTHSDLARLDVPRYVSVAAVAPLLITITTCTLLTTRIAKVAMVAMVFAALHFSGERCLVNELNGTLPAYDVKPIWKNYRTVPSLVKRECHERLPLLVQAPLAESQWLPLRSDPFFKSYLMCMVNTLYVLEPQYAAQILEPVHALDFEMHRQAIARARGFYFVALKEDPALDDISSQVARAFERQGLAQQQVVVTSRLVAPRVVHLRVTFTEAGH